MGSSCLIQPPPVAGSFWTSVPTMIQVVQRAASFYAPLPYAVIDRSKISDMLDIWMNNKRSRPWRPLRRRRA